MLTVKDTFLICFFFVVAMTILVLKKKYYNQKVFVLVVNKGGLFKAPTLSSSLKVMFIH